MQQNYFSFFHVLRLQLNMFGLWCVLKDHEKIGLKAFGQTFNMNLESDLLQIRSEICDNLNKKKNDWIFAIAASYNSE